MTTFGIEIEDTATPALENIEKSLAKTLSSGVFAAAQLTAGIIRREVMNTFRPGTGNLARSFKAAFVQKGKDKFTAGAFSDLVYARIQDEGGIIRPKTRKHLAIPLPGAGVPLGKWPRNFPKGELTFITSRRGNKLLARIRGGRIDPVFVLKKSVKLRGRNYIEAARKKAEPKIAELLDNEISVMIKKVSE